jgi:hypothetical protein
MQICRSAGLGAQQATTCQMLATTKSRSNTQWLFLWEYVKEKVFVPPVPVTLDLKQRVTTATAVVDDTLTRVWQEFDYLVDVCRVTKRVHTLNISKLL